MSKRKGRSPFRARRGEKKTQVNKKVRNATKKVVDGIQFQSSLEAYAYLQLKSNNIPAKYEQTTFRLLDKFRYKDESVRAITYTPDFIGDGFIIEVKGFKTDAFKLKWKLFKKHLLDNNMDYDLYLPRNQGQVRECCQQILAKIVNLRPVSL